MYISGKKSTESIDPSQFLGYPCASFDPKVRTLLYENEQFLKESSEKSSTTSRTGKRSKKGKNVVNKKTAVPTKASRQEETKASKETSAAKKKSTKQQETQDSDDARKYVYNVYLCVLLNEIDRLSAAAKTYNTNSE